MIKEKFMGIVLLFCTVTFYPETVGISRSTEEIPLPTYSDSIEHILQHRFQKLEQSTRIVVQQQKVLKIQNQIYVKQIKDTVE